MATISRRAFLQQAGVGTGAAGLLAANPQALWANPLGLPIGSQVYPLRSMLNDFPAFVKEIAGIGVTRLELCSPLGYGPDFASLADGSQVRKILADHGLKAESAHFTLAELRRDQSKSIAWAQQVGVTQMVVPTLGSGSVGSSPTCEQVRRAADEYNTIAAAAARAGMRQGLHNEGFEHALVEGKRVYDLLFDLLDPELVVFQFQMSAITAGLVAADYFRKYPGRFSSMHLQDVDLNAPPPAAQPAPKGASGGRRGGRRPQVALGQGSIDWVETFTAAKVGGITSYFVEQSWELTRQSVAYLKTLGV